MMVSFFACAEFGPHPPPRHQRWVVTVPPVVASAVAPSGNSRRWQGDMDGLVLYMEEVAIGVSYVGW